MVTKVGVYKDPRNKGKPWVCRWYTVADPETGKRKRVTRSFERKKEAEAFASQKAVDFKYGGRPEANPKKPKLGAFLKSYLRMSKPSLEPRSFELYEGTVTRLIDFFGKDCALDAITKSKAREFVVSQRSRQCRHEGEQLSDWTRAQFVRHGKTIFDMAVEDGLLRENPFKSKMLRTKKLATCPWYRMKADEYHKLLAVTQRLRDRVAYALFYTAGLRLHEAYNLTWDCIDFEKGVVLVVNRNATKDVPPFKIKDHEARTIPLPEYTVDLLTQWQAEAPEGVPFVLLTRDRFERVKAKWRRLRQTGQPWKTRYIICNVLKRFKDRVRRAGIEPVGKFSIHTLRKCAGQNWADYLPMNVVKELMGHSSIETTAEFYSTVDRDHQKKAAKVVQDLLMKKSDVKVTYEGQLA